MLFSQDDFYHLRKCHGMTVYYTIYIGSYDNIDGLKQKWFFNKTDSIEFNTSDKLVLLLVNL